MKKSVVYLNDIFEISKLPTEIEVDEQIVDIIITLNKKGYRTKYCCSGHYDDSKITDSISKDNISETEFHKFIEEHNIPIFSEDENNYYYGYPALGTSCYISFEKDVEIPFFPEGFEYEEKNIIRRRLDYYFGENFTHKKSEEEINLEIKTNVENLRVWVNKLPELIKKG